MAKKALGIGQVGSIDLLEIEVGHQATNQGGPLLNVHEQGAFADLARLPGRNCKNGPKLAKRSGAPSDWIGIVCLWFWRAESETGKGGWPSGASAWRLEVV
jgi:hypothetical protein